MFKVEFRDAIRTAIPSLIGLLKRKGYSGASSVVSLLADLSEYSKLHYYGCDVVNAREAEFREETKAAIPLLIELLTTEYYNDASSIVSLLAKLADYCALHLV